MSFIPKALLLLLLAAAPSAGEVILQYFGTPWREIERRLPELAEAGYDSLWLPPPFKGGAGGYSVGFDTLDRFDLGNKEQSGTLPTLYGTKAELESLVRAAHRFGLRVYFDNVMAHTAGPLDPVPPGTLLPGVPGFVPEDLHVGWNGSNWQKFADWPDWNDEWQVLNRNPFAWDIAQESPNTSFDVDGLQENSDFPKWSGVRHPGRTDYYADLDLTVATNGQGNPVHPFADREPFEDVGLDGVADTNDAGEGNGVFDFTDTDGDGQHDAGEVGEPFTDSGVDGSNPSRRTLAWGYGDGIYNMGDPMAEDVNSMLFRAIGWFIQDVKPDGFRLDAVKHVPSYFFGQQTGAEKDYSNAGYNGTIQEQFNIARGFSDWNNHRDSVFNQNVPRDDALLFGEHLGSPPAVNGYLEAGMRIASDDMLNAVKGSIGANLSGMDAPGFGEVFGNPAVSMNYVMSHDNNYLYGGDRPAAFSWLLLREGIPIVYTDGFNEAGAPDYFPKPAEVNFLGQFGDRSIPAALSVHRDLARGGQRGRWSDQDFLAFERYDDSEQGPAAGSWNDPTLLVMMARNYTGGAHGRGAMTTTFPAGARLRNYSPHGSGFDVVVQGDGTVRDTGGNTVLVPSGGYFAFAWRRPEMPAVWGGDAAREPIEIYQNGERAPTMTVIRRDGRDGDPDFNPYGLPGQTGGDYAYQMEIPRVTDGSQLRFLARADGSAENVLMKLDGGIDLNSQMGLGPMDGARRDFAPGLFDDRKDDQGDGNPANDFVKQASTDTYLGYEQMRFVARYREKFAASDIARNVIGSPGAETWVATIGTAGVSRNDGGGPNTGAATASWMYHDPGADNQLGTSTRQFTPAPENAADTPVRVWVKAGYQGEVDRVFLYYTTDGASWPEGSGGVGKAATQVIELADTAAGAPDGEMQTRWWSGTLPALPAGTVLRYKIGGTPDVVGSVFPFSETDFHLAERGETLFEVADFDAESVAYHPHNDYGEMATGLEEGYHVVRTRAFVNRNDGSSIFRTNTRTFYYDSSRPVGRIIYPAENDQLGGHSYEGVVTSDASVTEVWYRITDGSAANDGPGNGSWTQATLEAPSAFLRDSGAAHEWRFEYQNIPASGAATIEVRLLEDSSSRDMNLSDEDGWFTTLTRTVITGVGRTWNIGEPADGAVVAAGDKMRIYFTKSLADGISKEDFLDEVRILVASTSSGSAVGAVVQPKSSYELSYDATSAEHAVEFTFPNLFNGDENFLHYVRAIHRRGDQTLSDAVLVKIAPGPLADSDGDGLPDAWESQNGLQPANPYGIHGAAGDYDGDGLSNLEEYVFGLSPILPDAGQAPKVRLEAGEIGWSVVFPGIPGRLHTLSWSDDLNDWHPLQSNLETESDVDFQVEDPTTDGKRFYRADYEMKY
ncbi:alpha-amylase family glycosyl hydrolase [Haloferula sargassicola]|uniref:Glycosyl hydrolase family 13 catalytic domain-containing protein n=1 Tax=Haloferula sargassicola TaxID=490096 RepID=A0ABP9URS5_9BACT